MEAARKVSECTLLESLKIPAFTKQRLDRFTELFVTLPPGPLAVVPVELLIEAAAECEMSANMHEGEFSAYKDAVDARSLAKRLRAAVGGEGEKT
jgi:hypothetical protein